MNLQQWLLKVDYYLKNSTIGLLTRLLFKPSNDFEQGNILIFRTGSIGDSICAFPAIAAIRHKYPTSPIFLLTNPAGKNISMEYLLDPKLNIQIVNYQKLGVFELLRMLKKGNYDLFIELPQTHSSWITNVRNLLTAKAIGATYGFGWQVYATSLFKQYQEKNNHFVPEAERLLRILENEGISGNASLFPLAFTLDSKQKVSDFLRVNGIEDTSKNIGIVAGAKRSTNRWPSTNFRQVLLHLSQKGFSLILIGGPDDVELNLSFIDIPNVINGTGKFTPIESALLMEKCRIVISNDTGPLHMSYAVGTPVIGIFSSRDYPTHWYPPSSSVHKVLRSNDVPCSVCLLEVCPNQLRCLEEIKPSQVLSAVDELLKLP